MIDAVVFDLDGLLLDTEQLWDEVRAKLARERGGRWSERAQADRRGLSGCRFFPARAKRSNDSPAGGRSGSRPRPTAR